MVDFAYKLLYPPKLFLLPKSLYKNTLLLRCVGGEGDTLTVSSVQIECETFMTSLRQASKRVILGLKSFLSAEYKMLVRPFHQQHLNNFSRLT